MFNLFKSDAEKNSKEGQDRKISTPEDSGSLVKELYERNAELAVRNKTLALLRKLDEISLATLSTKEMAEKITDSVATELGYELVSIAIVDEGTKMVRWLSIASATPWIVENLENLDKDSIKAPVGEGLLSTTKGLEGQGPHFSEDPNTVFPKTLIAALNQIDTARAEKSLHYSTLYPLWFGGKVLGILTLSSSRSFDDISTFEHEAVAGVVGLVSLALYKTKIYAELQDLTNNLQKRVDEQTEEIKRAYEVEKKARVELEELDKVKDQFILSTEHHLRTPLTVARGYVDVIKNSDPETPIKTVSEKVGKIGEAMDKLGNLINELLDISQLQTGKAILKEELHDEIERKDLNIKLSFPENPVVSEISVDIAKITSALSNIIDNAIKYNKEGGVLEINGNPAQHPIEKDKKVYRIMIKDTGIGVSPEEMPKLFSYHFERGKEAEKMYATGRGIGLAVAKSIVQSHGGKIFAESEGQGKGTTFTVELPIELTSSPS